MCPAEEVATPNRPHGSPSGLRLNIEQVILIFRKGYPSNTIEEVSDRVGGFVVSWLNRSDLERQDFVGIIF